MILHDREMVWGESRFRTTLELVDSLPPVDSIATAHCLAFDADGRFLLARHVEREWTIPGGHREPGESVEDALHREAYEEAAAVIADPVLLAAERIELLEGVPNPRYTQPSFQVFYVARVVQLDELTANAECLESRLFPVDEARQLPGWLDHNQVLFDAALALARIRGLVPT